jgi:hypothetical protein
MAKDISKLIDELAKNSDRILINPNDLELLKKQGLLINTIPPQTINELFEERKKNAFIRIKELPPLPENVQPEIQALYQEIRESILFGLDGAAITMSSILIELILKHATFIKEAGGYQKADPEKWDEFEKMELCAAIKRAENVGLLDSKMAERLHSFRATIRNPYNHYNIKKITQDVVAEKVKRLDIKTGEVKEIDIPAKESPMIWAQVKPIVDKKYVLSVFYFADEVVKYLVRQIKNDVLNP